MHSVSTKPKLRTYVMFNDSLATESYLTANLPKNLRSLICQIRLGILLLRIETGRYINEPVQSRTCLICNTNEVEDEIHFLFNCPMYNNERELFYQSLSIPQFVNRTNEDKLKVIFEHPYKLGNYICQLNVIRKSILYKTNR